MTEPTETYIGEGTPKDAKCQACRRAPAVAHMRVEFPGVTDDIRVCANCLKVRMIALVTQETDSWMRIVWRGNKLIEVPIGTGTLEVNNDGGRKD